MKIHSETKKLNIHTPLAELAQVIFENTYLKPFPGKQKADRPEPTLERISHGAQHASRVTAFVRLFVDLYRAMGNQEALHLTEREIKILQIVALFHDAARQDELKDLWEKESAELCRQFLEKMGVTAEEAEKSSSLILKKEKGGLLGKIFQSADCLDIIRCKRVFHIERMSVYQDADPAWKEVLANQIVPTAAALIAAQFDLRNDISIQLEGKELFTQQKMRDLEFKAKNYEHAKNVYEAITADFKKYPVLTPDYWSSEKCPIEKEVVTNNETIISQPSQSVINELRQAVAGHEDNYLQFFSKSAHFFEANTIDWKQAQAIISKELPSQWAKRGFVLRNFSPDLLSENQDKKTFHYIYQDKKTAQTHLDFLKLLLAEQYPDLIAHGRVIENPQHQQTPYHIELSQEQHKALTNLRLVASLIKSIRFDEYCFIYEFIFSITKSLKNQFHSPLRIGKHKKYTVFASGVYPYDQKPSPYPNDRLDEKLFLSQAQSTSMIDVDLQIPVFGHAKVRADKLVGVIVDFHEALINRYFIYDGGTVDHPQEADTKEEAEKYYQVKVKGKNPVLFGSEKEFKQEAKKNTTKINELLARIKWNINTSSVGIFSDSFSARCIAQAYAHLIHKRLKEQYQEMGLSLPAEYEVPMHFYLPGKNNNLMRYPAFQQEQDKDEADKIMTDPNKIMDAFAKKDYEFLLIQRTPDKLFSLEYNNLPFLLYLITQGLFAFAKILFSRTDLAKTKSFEDYILEIAKQHEPEFNKQSLTILNSDGDTPLHVAVRQQRVKLLPLWENNLDILNNKGWTPLHLASHYGCIDSFQWLLEKGARLNLKYLKENKIETVLYMAAKYGRLDIVKFVLEKGNQLNLKDNVDETVLPVAFEYDHLDIVKFVLEKNSDHLNFKANDHIGMAVIHLVAKHGRLDIVKFILEKNNDQLNLKDNSGRTVLHVATEYGHLDIVKFVLEKNSGQLNLKDNSRHTMLHIAAARGYLDIVKFVLEKNNELHEKTQKDSIALLKAIKLGYTNAAKLFWGVYSEQKTMFGYTALHQAACNGHVDIVKLLLEYGANLEAKQDEGITALHLAACNGHVDVVKLLLQKGANYDVKTNKGITALHTAAADGHIEVVKVLIKAGANLWLQYKDGYFSRTALELAANEGKNEVVEVVIDYFISLIKKNTLEAAQYQSIRDDLIRCLNRQRGNALAHFTFYKLLRKLKDNSCYESLVEAAKFGHQQALKKLHSCQDKTALYGLGMMYLNGDGVPKDINNAEKYFTLSGTGEAKLQLLKMEVYDKNEDFVTQLKMLLTSKSLSSQGKTEALKILKNCASNSVYRANALLLLAQAMHYGYTTGNSRPEAADYYSKYYQEKPDDISSLLPAIQSPEILIFLDSSIILNVLKEVLQQKNTEGKSFSLFFKWLGDNNDLLQKILKDVTLLSELAPLPEWQEFLQQHKVQKVIRIHSNLSNNKSTFFFPHEYLTQPYVNANELIKNANEVYLEKKK